MAKSSHGQRVCAPTMVFVAIVTSIFILATGCSAAARLGAKAAAKEAPKQAAKELPELAARKVPQQVAEEAPEQVAKQADSPISRQLSESSVELKAGGSLGINEFSKVISMWGAEQVGRELTQAITLIVGNIAPSGTEEVLKRATRGIIRLSQAGGLDPVNSTAQRLIREAGDPHLTIKRLEEGLADLVDKRWRMAEQDFHESMAPRLGLGDQTRQCALKAVSTLKQHAVEAFVLARFESSQSEYQVDQSAFLDDYLNRASNELNRLIAMAPANNTPAARCGSLVAAALRQTANDP